MSVINKMLRDLDARRVEGQLPDLQRPISQASLQGTASVSAAHSARSRRWLVLLAGAVVLAGGVFWALEAMRPVALPPAAVAPAVPQVPVAPPEPAVAQAPAAAETPPPKALARGPESPSAVSPANTQRSESTSRAEPPPKQLPPATPKRGPDAAPVPAPTVPPQSPTPLPAAPAASPTPAVAAAAPKESGLSAERRHGAAIETLAQAQALWNAGSREAGLDLVREAVTAIERAQPRDNELLARLVREQVRMELVLGRAGSALALLTRLEPELTQHADLWAVRGNAAQRLGRHSEAVHAYLAALQLRPGEPRWMLGAAVSLAAQGQLEAAALQAEQARALGPVSPEVLTYLRQAGVPLR